LNKRRPNSTSANRPRPGLARETGRYVTISTVGDERVRAFVPDLLPPRTGLDIDRPLRGAFDSALLALGRLDGVSVLLPDTGLFLYSYIRKEAVLSSQIEGSESSLSDLLLSELDEAPGVPLDDVAEVSCYVAALEHGLARMRGGFPISNRLIRELHQRLLRSGRGATKSPGEFRRSQNWIGGTRPGNARFVPPPPNLVPELMSNLERFLHDQPERTPTLFKAAIGHVQFETVHPFLDGNGRVGRLLITMLLVSEGVLREPLLYLSLYFKQHRQAYYDRLDGVRTRGDWRGWLHFFAEAVTWTAGSAVDTAHRLTTLFQADRGRIQATGRGASSLLQVHGALQARPLQTIASVAASTKLTIPTVTKALDGLRALGIVRETTGRRRGRVYAYDQYLQLLSAGTERP
jgi:Fic family protein